ncbi:MAG: oligoendopeptidase F, partial [Bacilli bacterium]|nr:oligoendopeptidase F [Bacilli bacterium]
MPIKEKSRDEIKDYYKWNLSLIYDNDTNWYEDYKNVETNSKEFLKYKGIILDSPENLLNTLKDLMWLERKLSKLYVYAYMRGDEDMGNTYYQKLRGEVDNLNLLVSEITSFVIPELIQGDYSKVQTYINELPELLNYRRMLDDIYRFKKYTLSDTEEKLLSKLSKVLDIPDDTASLLRNSDM